MYKYFSEEIMGYEDREKLKSLANDLREKAETNFQKAKILLWYNIRAHYWRAREDLENRSNCKSLLKKIRGKNFYRGYVLDIDHYTENWLYSMRNHIWMKDGVYEELCRLYTPKKNKYLSDGHTIYQFNNEEA